MARAEKFVGPNGFRRSSFCAGGECVAVAQLSSGEVFVKSTKAEDASKLRFTRDEWDAFIKGVKNGEFDARS